MAFINDGNCDQTMEQQSHIDRSKSRSSSAGRSFFGRTVARRDGSNGDSFSDDIKGPFGLTTLFSPAESAVADMVFVHGLGGGSRSTWTKSSDPSLFWPQEWLPQDSAFQDVRIHSFGYNSNWDKESTLNVHDFAKSLLGSIQDCPDILRESNVSTTFYIQRSGMKESPNVSSSPIIQIHAVIINEHGDFGLEGKPM